MDMDTKKHNVH